MSVLQGLPGAGALPDCADGPSGVQVSDIGYLSLVQSCRRGCLVPGHCLIVPMDHVASCRLADEQVWTEMRNFKKCLVQMYAAEARTRLHLLEGWVDSVCRLGARAQVW